MKCSNGCVKALNCSRFSKISDSRPTPLRATSDRVKKTLSTSSRIKLTSCTALCMSASGTGMRPC